ncbi:unnamed protein product [Polarella glacialis]|uniref:Uncharacterized protein n=1 Tax=Polarella glacialis TaxID=89957 RepID=A0A813D2T8_POLGL|nr:unnamed protein product [Polarella glacialis]
MAPETEAAHEDIEKRIKAVTKKLKQIEGLKEKSPDQLDEAALAKICFEPQLQAEVAALKAELTQGGSSVDKLGEQLETLKLGSAVPQASDAAQSSKDPHAIERAKALELLPGEYGALIGSDTEKEFKKLQKKLRDIGKLHEKDNLDKTQQEKLSGELIVIKAIQDILSKAEATAKRKLVQEAARGVAKAGYPASSNSAGVASGGVHLNDAVTGGLIAERRAKYLGSGKQWADTFCGAFRVHPPKSHANQNFSKMKTFEYFLWSDIKPQPSLDYLKRTIAYFVDVRTCDFYFETMAGTKLDAT